MKKRKKAVALKSVVKQKAFSEAEGKLSILNSIKLFADGTKRIDRATITPKMISEIKKIKKGDVETLRKKFYFLCREGFLKIDSASEKKGLCKHARARQHCFNPLAMLANRPDLVVNYGKSEK